MKKILIGVVLALLLFIGGCVAVTALAVNEADKALQEEERNDAPTEVTEGEAFTHDDFAVAAGWKIRRDALGDLEIVLEVTNEADEARSPWLTIKLTRGTKTLASADCLAGADLEPGTSADVECTSTDKLPKSWQKVTVEDGI